MRVVCPYLGHPHPDTREALELWPGHVEYVDLADDPDYGYGKLLRQLWADAEDFTIVEHDVVPGRLTLAGFDACPDVYCAAPYPWKSHLGPALGCTKFGSLLLRCYPDAAEIACRLPSAFGRPGHWRQLDVRLMQGMRDLYGLQPHCHAPVEHRNPEKQLEPGALYVTKVVGQPFDVPPGLLEEIAAEVAACRV